ncbi:MAG: hypothetical protein CMN05_14850 [Roseibacillus sp.]|jgi:hypothetical protein|nr:hypothetical protein [Roseibacillus sp.]MBP36619.1 hypothetical protein [Roseibacillus sp.]
MQELRCLEFELELIVRGWGLGHLDLGRFLTDSLRPGKESITRMAPGRVLQIAIEQNLKR